MGKGVMSVSCPHWGIIATWCRDWCRDRDIIIYGKGYKVGIYGKGYNWDLGIWKKFIEGVVSKKSWKNFYSWGFIWDLST